MKVTTIIVLILMSLMSCNDKVEHKTKTELPIKGTWQLLTGTLIEHGDTTVTDYTKKISFIKIINDTHFAFLQHDLNHGKDTSAVFTAGGGRYSLKDSLYSEQLEYCTARNWEGHDFNFTVKVKDDTLIQRGIEKIESENINRINIEKYVRLKNNLK